MYVGSLIDSGWGGGNNRGEICQVTYTHSLPTGIREVTAYRNGFIIEFTNAVDSTKASRPEAYTLSAATRKWKGGYSTPDSDITTCRVEKVRVSNDRRSVALEVAPLKTGYLYDVHVTNLTADDEDFFPSEAYYTLNEVPHINVESHPSFVPPTPPLRP